MKFIIKKHEKIHNYSILYRSEDLSFDAEPLEEGGITSIMINDLQLQINEKGEIIYVWGYCPLFKHEETNQAPKNYESNTLIAVLDKPLIPGVSYRLNEDERWPIYINNKKEWICIGNPNTKGKKMIEFVPNCIATMDGQDLIAIWVHPKDFPELA